MSDEQMQKTLESLSRKHPNRPIAVTADLANDNLNSICRLSLAWISDGSVHGLTFLIKPPTDEFTCRKITADMVADCQPFADVWDGEIKILLKNAVLSAYSSEQLFLAIKASYEASGKPFSMEDAYVRDLKFLAAAYIADLENFSFLSIMHYMNISVDLDNSLSRAMACACGMNWMENLYPIGNYGLPLSAVMAGALHEPTEEETQRKAEAHKTLEQAAHYMQRLFLPFVLLCLILAGYYLYSLQENAKTHVDFSQYSSVKAVPPEQKPSFPAIETNKEYLMLRGTYIVCDARTIPEFLDAFQNHDVELIRQMVRSEEVIVFMNPTRVKSLSPADEKGFVLVKILGGEYDGATGYAHSMMLE